MLHGGPIGLTPHDDSYKWRFLIAHFKGSSHGMENSALIKQSDRKTSGDSPTLNDLLLNHKNRLIATDINRLLF